MSLGSILACISFALFIIGAAVMGNASNSAQGVVAGIAVACLVIGILLEMKES